MIRLCKLFLRNIPRNNCLLPIKYFSIKLGHDMSKYQRTYHLPFSSGTNDDKKLDDASHFLNKEIVISSKIDGSNVSLLRDDVFARTHAHAPTHPSFDLLKQIHSNIKRNIDEHHIIYSEYVYARHSILYTQLPSYLFIFNILDMNTNSFLSWSDVETVGKELDIPTAPVLFRGECKTEKDLENVVLFLANEHEFNVDEREGVVIRVADSFHADDFSMSIAKYVKKSFAESIGDEHWKHKEIVKNGLKK